MAHFTRNLSADEIRAQADAHGNKLWVEHRELGAKILHALVEVWLWDGRAVWLAADALAEWIGEDLDATFAALQYLATRGVISGDSSNYCCANCQPFRDEFTLRYTRYWDIKDLGLPLPSELSIPEVSANDSPAPANPRTRKPISRESRAAVWDKTGGKCHYCGCPLNPFVNWTVDHVLAVSKGGTNDLDNLVPCCKSCNSRKGTKDWRTED